MQVLRVPHLVLAVVAACAVALAFTSGASGATCAVTEAGPLGPAGDRLDVTAEDFEELEVERVGQRLRVREVSEQDDETVRVVQCGGPPATVTTIDAVALTVVQDPRFEEISGIEDDLNLGLTLDFEEGLLVPGATDEGDGSSEIEVSIAPASPQQLETDLIVLGTPGPDSFAVRGGPTPGINLNSGETTADLDVVGGSFVDAGLLAGAGDDLITGVGPTPAEDAPVLATFGESGNDTIIAGSGLGFARGGGGADTYIGSPKRDFFFGGGGSDTIRTGGSRDLVVAGPGADLLDLGSGKDVAFTADKSRDRIRCGPGRDVLGLDRRDRRKGCELREFQRGKPDLFD